MRVGCSVIRLLSFIVISAPLWAGSAIVDTLKYRFNGEAANCTLYVTDVTPSADGSTTYTPATLVYRVVNGVVNFSLEPNDAATPAGTTYSVRYACPPGKMLPPEIWRVPTGGPFTIRAVRVAVIPNPVVLFPPSQLNFAGFADGCLKLTNGQLNTVPCRSGT